MAIDHSHFTLVRAKAAPAAQSVRLGGAARRTLARCVALLGSAFTVLGCGHSEAASAPANTTPATEAPAQEPIAAPASPAASPPEAPDRAAHMQSTFWLAVVARDAVIAGDLEGAKRAADALAQHDYDGALPEGWKHWVARMQQRAGEVAIAPDLRGAALAVAALGLSCGDCHAQLRPPPKLHGDEPLAWKDPPERLEERMYRHAVGAEQLWHGLMQPSDGIWQSGTVTLTRAPLRPALRDGDEIDAVLAAKVEEIRELAKLARRAASHPERAAVYGELIARCAVCHFSAAPAGVE